MSKRHKPVGNQWGELVRRLGRLLDFLGFCVWVGISLAGLVLIAIAAARFFAPVFGY